ncbi:hypothetical protein, partial [Xanthomonas populi]|uniref:hypothetical protein n=1 Tax=Xanthomonas populi TaxID=53414 RepID=UPI001ABFE4CD
MRALVSTRSGCNQLIYLGKTWGNLRVEMVGVRGFQQSNLRTFWCGVSRAVMAPRARSLTRFRTVTVSVCDLPYTHFCRQRYRIQLVLLAAQAG